MAVSAVFVLFSALSGAINLPETSEDVYWFETGGSRHNREMMVPTDIDAKRLHFGSSSVNLERVFLSVSLV